MFKLPKIPLKDAFLSKDLEGLAQFQWLDLTEKEQLGQGAFGTVFTAKYEGRRVVVKKHLGYDRAEKKKFLKEAKLLNNFSHEHIVKFESFCANPTAIMLEYLFFDFGPFFGRKELRVSCLEDFLSYLDEFDAVDFFPVQNKILSDIAKGLQYLHEADCHHRDLKTANVLVSNQHYCHLTDVDLLEAEFKKEPIICKLTDFGESRSEAIQTAEVACTSTNNVVRGTPVYMAPEIVCDSRMAYVRSRDLKRIDIWAFGMIVYSVVNPDISYPFQRDLEMARNASKEKINALRYIKGLLEEKQKPTASPKYKNRQETNWSPLMEIYAKCTNVLPCARPTIEEVLHYLDGKAPADEVHSEVHHCKILPLKVHQGSAVEDVDRQIAMEVPFVNTSLTNDGTNSCAFLCVIMAERLSLKASDSQPSWEEVAAIAEQVIRESPSAINQLRDKELLYDVHEAYSILHKGEILQHSYEMTEEIISSSFFSSEEGKNELTRGIQNLRNVPDRVGVALYTCAKAVVLVGSFRGQLCVIDTHAVIQNANGEKTACVVVFERHPNEVQHLCSWLVEMMRKRKVQDPKDQLQSFSIMKRNNEIPRKPLADANSQYDSEDHEEESQESSDSEESDMSVIIIDQDCEKTGNNDRCSDSEEDEDLLHSPFEATSRNHGTSRNTGDCKMDTGSSPENLDVSTVRGLPVLNSPCCGLKLTEILSICIGQKVPKGKICTKVPTMVDRSAVFVIDLEVVNPIDLAADDCGAYGRHSSPSVAVEMDVDDSGDLEQSVRILSKEEELQPVSKKRRRFVVRRQYSWHSLSKDYRRIISKVEDSDNKLLRYAIVQYIVETKDPSSLFKKPYGNSKNREVYVRTKPSVLAKIREIGQKGSAKEIITEVENEIGDVRAVSSPSYLPRDRNQVYRQVRKLEGRIKSRSTGPIATPDFTKLLSMQYSGSFIRNISFSVSTDKKKVRRATPNTFAASETCLGWVKRFCTGTNPTAVAGIDMTFKLGQFYLTTMTFPNPMFVLKSNDQRHPTTLAAMMTSVTKEKQDYEFMARCLKTEGVSTLTYGMDGECAMESGFEDVFPIHDGCSGANIHLRCFDHVRDDIKQKLLSLDVSEVRRKEIIDGILGKEYEGTREMGLVDSETQEEFEKKYRKLESKWPEGFKKWMMTNIGRLRSLKKTLTQCMMKNVRIAAGLGDPPNKWSNQRTESLNNVIKEANKCQTSDQVAIHEIIETKVVKQQEREYVKAIYNSGEYRLAPKYKKYSVGPLEWSRKTEEQRKEYVKKVLQSDIHNVEDDEQQVIIKKLSVNLSDCGVQTVAPGLLNQIWHKAEIILSHHQIFDLGNDVYCVTEFGTSTDVKVNGGKIICFCRQSHSTAGLCQHSLVVAESRGALSDYLSSFKTSSEKSNKILFNHIPKRAGEKPKEKKKRKGQNNIQAKPVCSEKRLVDHDIDFQKAKSFTEIWHNANPFNVVFTRDTKKAFIKCESCKVEFAKGEVICIPQDIAVHHMERYHYPVKNKNGHLIEMKPTWKKEASKFYCPRKECILKRHPYFWKGMLEIDANTRSKLKEGHRKYLQNELHFVC